MRRIRSGSSVARAAALGLCAAFLSGGAYAVDDGGHRWGVHDMNRPQPKVVDPGTASTQEKAGRPPSDAIVLFDGKDLSQWVGRNNSPARWKVTNGYMEVTRKAGGISTKQPFGSCQLHVEWSGPAPARGASQGRGNSGVFIMSKYEIQVLDNYKNKTYPDGQAASAYGQSPPLVNACRRPGEWQTYDIVFHRPHFDGTGKCVKPATVTVIHNGVLALDHYEMEGASTHKRRARYSRHADKLPISLQDHGNPVRYRNIWIRPLED